MCSFAVEMYISKAKKYRDQGDGTAIAYDYYRFTKSYIDKDGKTKHRSDGCRILYFRTLQLGDVSRVAPIDKLSVVITICLSFMFLKEPINAKVIVDALLITAGSIVMLYK